MEITQMIYSKLQSPNPKSQINLNRTHLKFQRYLFSVIPGKAGIQKFLFVTSNPHWIPAGVYPVLDTGRE